MAYIDLEKGKIKRYPHLNITLAVYIMFYNTLCRPVEKKYTPLQMPVT